MLRFLPLLITALMAWIPMAQGQLVFPDGDDVVTVDPDAGPTGNGRIYVGDHSLFPDPCHYRTNLPPGKVIRAAVIGKEDGVPAVGIANGQGALSLIPLSDFEKVDKNGNPCTNSASAQIATAAVSSQATSIPVSNDADAVGLSCDSRFAVVVGANSATPVCLVDLVAHQEVDTYAYDGIGRNVAVCDDGSVLVALNSAPVLTNSVLRRLTIAQPGQFNDPGEELTLGPNVEIRKVFSVPGSKTCVALTTESTDTNTVSRLVSLSIPGLQVLDSVPLSGLIGHVAAVSCAGDKVYVRSGKGGPQPDFIEGFTYDPVTGAIGDAASVTITNVSFATTSIFEHALAISRDGTRLIASETAVIPTPEVPAPQVTIFDATTGARLGKLEGPEFVSPGTVATVPCCATNSEPFLLCSLAPQADTNLVGETHTVVATVTSNGVPISGITVDFTVTAGPNSGETDSDTTDANGEAVFTYTSDGTPGSDAISATGSVNSVAFACSANKVWTEGVADLSVTKTASPDPVEVDGDITYTITVTNRGPGTASNVVLVDTLPNGVTFVSDTGGCDEVDGVVTCDLGPLASGEFAEIDIDATAAAAGLLTNTVAVASDASDPVPANNTAQAISTVAAQLPDMAPEIADEDILCDDTKGLVCQLLAEVALLNNDVAFATGTFSFAAACKKCPDSVKWKLSGTLTLTSLDLTGIPDHALALYLSEDDEVDAGDIALIKKPIEVLTLVKLFQSGKPLNLKAKVPAGADLSELFLLLVVDDGDAVPEADEENNAAAFGPLN